MIDGTITSDCEPWPAAAAAAANTWAEPAQQPHMNSSTTDRFTFKLVNQDVCLNIPFYLLIGRDGGHREIRHQVQVDPDSSRIPITWRDDAVHKLTICIKEITDFFG